MSKSKKQLRVEAVQRLKELDGDIPSYNILKALYPQYNPFMDGNLHMLRNALIDLLTDDDCCCHGHCGKTLSDYERLSVPVIKDNFVKVRDYRKVWAECGTCGSCLCVFTDETNNTLPRYCSKCGAKVTR